MNVSKKKLARIACDIHSRLAPAGNTGVAEAHRSLETLNNTLQRLDALRRKLRICINRNWHGAKKHTMDALRYALDEIPGHVERIGQIGGTGKNLASIRDVHSDLGQVDQEFGGLFHDAREHAISVRTEEIELEGIYLGDFEIWLHIPCLGKTECHDSYRIRALDPHPAAEDESVTHPHVKDEILCPGDAATGIRAALMHGRICDFFLIIQSVLNTYNPGSPHIALRDWDGGSSCYSCGYITASENLSWCERCEYDFCESCISWCESCERTVCRDCMTECEACNEYFCHTCAATCPDCDRLICGSCREAEKCPCIGEREEDEDEEDTNREGELVDNESDGGQRTNIQREAGSIAA